MLLEAIKAKSLELRKAKDPQATLLSSVLGDINNRAKSGKVAREPNDDDALAVIQNYCGGLRETILTCESSGRDASGPRDQLLILEGLLPTQMTDDDLRTIISHIITSHALVSHAKSIGVVMGQLNANHKGAFNKERASTITKECLGL